MIRFTLPNDLARKRLKDWNINPDRCWIVLQHELEDVREAMADLGIPEGPHPRIHPYGGYAVTFDEDTADLDALLCLRYGTAPAAPQGRGRE